MRRDERVKTETSTAARRTLLDSPIVIELGDRAGVGLAGSLLAQLGARVVLVEPAVPSKQAPAPAGYKAPAVWGEQ